VCVLVPGPTASAEARVRLDELVATEDGFALAEADLSLRGPGELWGMRQSGVPRLKLADLRDERLLTRAHEAAKQTVSADPRLLDPAHRPLKDALLRDYREALELALAG
jgi:ATP-dependent DNA helicase RecG